MKTIPKIKTLFCILISSNLVAAENYQAKYEDKDIMFRIVERTPENISAFYEGREFSKQAIDEILNTCYFTVIVHNKTRNTLWLELDNWQFIGGEKFKQPIQRIKRDYWNKRWNKINLKQAHRSTFGWTLMPESRDLRADEGVGGSITLPQQTKPFNVIAKFLTKPDKSGSIKVVNIQGAQCVKDIKPTQ